MGKREEESQPCAADDAEGHPNRPRGTLSAQAAHLARTTPHPKPIIWADPLPPYTDTEVVQSTVVRITETAEGFILRYIRADGTDSSQDKEGDDK